MLRNINSWNVERLYNKSTINLKQMFFGQVISQSTPYTFSPDTVSEEAGEVLSITNIVLAPSSKVYSFFISRNLVLSGSKNKINNSWLHHWPKTDHRLLSISLSLLSINWPSLSKAMLLSMLLDSMNPIKMLIFPLVRKSSMKNSIKMTKKKIWKMKKKSQLPNKLPSLFKAKLNSPSLKPKKLK